MTDATYAETNQIGSLLQTRFARSIIMTQTLNLSLAKVGYKRSRRPEMHLHGLCATYIMLSDLRSDRGSNNPEHGPTL